MSTVAVDGESSQYVALGFRLDALRIAFGEDSIGAAVLSQVTMLSALHAHGDARIILQYHADPDNPDPELRLRVTLLALVPTGSAAATPESLAELSDDLEDLLRIQRRWFQSTGIDDPDELSRALEPFTPGSVAEIVRREEQLGAAMARRRIGFGVGLDKVSVEGFWGYSAFQGVPQNWQRLVELLLLQEDEVAIRVVAAPTTITPDERAGVVSLRASFASIDSFGPMQAAAGATLESIAFVDACFETQILVASPSRLSPGMLEGAGSVISLPMQSPVIDGVLAGGFDVRRDLPPDTFASALTALVESDAEESVAPVVLRRLRRVMGPWELSTALRFPLPDGPSYPGMRVLRTPMPPSHLARLPEAGAVVGVIHDGHGSDALRIGTADRMRHTYILGQTGTGKSTLIANLVAQDLLAGEGVALIDPHGDLVDAVLGMVPDERLDDVILVDPADQEAVVGLNILEAESDLQAAFIVSDLCEFFQRLFDPRQEGIVGPRFQSWLRMACGTVMPTSPPGTLCDVPRVFTDDAFLSYCRRSVEDPLIQSFWTDEMGQTSSHTKSEMLGWFTSKFSPFISDPLVRRIIGQPRSTFSFSRAMDERKILLVKLSKGLIGEFNADILGHVIVAKLWAAALGRANRPVSERVPFHLYVDEFQNMTSGSLPAMLSEARKFGMSLTLANQFFGQVPVETRSAIAGNVGSKIVFRLGFADAALWAETFGSRSYSEEHLRLMPNYLAVAELLADGSPMEPLLVGTAPPVDSTEERAMTARQRSRENYGVTLDAIKQVLQAMHADYATGVAEQLVQIVYDERFPLPTAD